ncbi:TerB family tellurite resistance protein [Falsigemmobacter intermedius]|uniref:TerB family tellurite resistance protein n=1 Tax=Falsigemmobacter intermedius TaxID=1553448 RepID=A0A444MD65_9RHOB|nr:TerB family tellurite resistance protein [Falsigemmobacter intermedius]RWY42361.1 TerB family tellurite resistance protein [Falsigemmobacter intermedius]
MVSAFLRRLLAPAPAPVGHKDATLALAALLVRIARSDGEYAETEKARIDRVMMSREGLSSSGAGALRQEAEGLEAEAPDTVRFTRALKEAVAPEERLALVEALWSVALADGGRDASEDRLMRLVVSLLGVTDVDSGIARQRALRAEN